ncbi:MAG TPA: hypothetical protein DGH68_08735 [Bacteroidetes bacterium]|nr:hypothetical protein [Bacteroidota bacterium]
MKTYTIMFGFIILTSEITFSQNLPYLHTLTIRATSTFENATQMYFYSYSLSNDQNNNGNVWVFEVDISRDANSIAFDTSGLIFATSWMESAFRRHYPSLSSRIIPVGFPSLPQFWGGAVSSNLTGGFDKDTLMPAPGQSVSGLVLMSRGLPGIRRCTVKPVFNVFALYPSLDEVDNPDSLDAKVEQDREAVNFSSVIIGPYAPPAFFNGLTFLDTVKSYVTRSRSLGWITSQSTANKYTRLVDSAHSNLRANKRGVAKAKLDSVLLNVHTDSASTLTSEAYALIRFNTEYVLNTLRAEDSTFAAENKSSSADATMSNSARHLVKSGSYLHGVFASGGEIFYRRSTNEGSMWTQTHRINTAVGQNALPCITTTQNGSVQIVWQRQIGDSTYEVWHSYSQDDGASWSTPAILPDAADVGVSGYQTEGPMPVIAEGKCLVAVYCSNEGLRYRISEDEGNNWQVPETDIINGEYNDRVRFPSLAGGDSYVSLIYDYADDTYSPWSRISDGTSWSDESTVGKGTDISDAEFSCVTIDRDQNPITAWTGTSSNLTWGKVITFRSGYSDNSWSDWFTIFGQNFVDRLSPSLAYYNNDGKYGVGIVHHTSQDFIKLIKLTSVDPPSWDISTLNESGAWANITQETYSSGTPIYCWTDQSTFPHKVIVGPSSALAHGKDRAAGLTNTQGVSQKRRAVVYHRRLRATLALEFRPMKIVLANGDTTVVPFKKSSLRQRGKINYSNMWDYLGSDVIGVPPNARRLVVSKQFDLRGPSVAQRKFFLRVLNASGTFVAVLDTTSTSGTVSVNIALYAGMNVTFRPSLVLSGIEPASVDVGVGDVFTLTDESSKQSQPKKK